jgi:hypothetical protein
MATRRTTGRFGDEKGVQRNKDNDTFEGARPNRSPGQSNANRARPSLNEDVVESQRRDNQRIGRGLMPTAQGGGGRKAQQEAGGRAVTRTGGRAGLLALAAELGYTAGRVIGNLGGDELVRKGIEKSGLGEKIDKAATGDRVELSKESKARIAAGELEKGKDERVNKKDFPTYKKDTKSAEAFRKEFKAAKESGKDSFSFEGRKYNTDDKKEMAKGGMVANKGIGASMKPHNVFGKKK